MANKKYIKGTTGPTSYITDKPPTTGRPEDYYLQIL